MKPAFLQQLDRYETFWSEPEYRAMTTPETEQNLLKRFRARLAQSEPAFAREVFSSHLTASAVIVPHTFDRVLLTHHRKLNLWLQLGGHVENDPSMETAALREATEESGLSDLELSPIAGDLFPLDLDIHTIPARPQEPEHEHFDVRYLMVTREPERIQISEESSGLRWFSWEEAIALDVSPAMQRQLIKVCRLRGTPAIADHLPVAKAGHPPREAAAVVHPA